VELPGVERATFSPGISPGAAAPFVVSVDVITGPVQRFCSAASGFSGLVVHKEIHLSNPPIRVASQTHNQYTAWPHNITGEL